MKYKALNSSSGQATTEYILVLVVTVGIILGTVTQLNRSFASFIDSYFGDYVGCLLEAGELPALGLDEQGVEALQLTCNQEYQPFTIQNGRPPLANTNSGNGNSSNRGANSDRGLSDAGESSGPSFRSARSRGGSGSSGLGGDSSGSGGGTVRRSGEIISGEGSGSSSSGGGFSQKFGSGDGDGFGANDRVTSFNIKRKGKKLKLDDEGEVNLNTPIKQEDSGSGPRVVSFGQKKRAPAKVEADTEFDLGVGDYFRYLIIAGIIIALVVFLGGQALSISKGME